MKKIQPMQVYDMAKGEFVDNPKYKPKTRRKPKSETNILTKQIMDFVEAAGWFPMRINVAGFYRADTQSYIKSGSTLGVPDLLCSIDGCLIGVEVKVGADKQSEVQKQVEDKIRATGNYYLIAKTFDQFKFDFKLLHTKKPVGLHGLKTN